MARSITEIYDSIVLEKSNQTQLQALQPNIDNSQNLLQDLSSPSKVANWRLFYWVTAVAIWVLEKLFDNHVIEINDKLNSKIPGTPQWYKEQALIFQYGDNLTFIDNKFQYATVDDTKKVVDKCAIVEQNGLVIVKTAKDNNGNLEPLSSQEHTAFMSYMNKIKFAGTKINFINDNADMLKIAYNIYYNPLVLAPNGSLLSDSSIFPVEDAINDYLSNLEFNGDLVLSRLTDKIQLAPGVEDQELITAEAKYGSFSYQPINVKYSSNAGYMIIDPAFPLNTQLNYIANV